ncbi:tetratricopeptide repeat protein [Thalassobellus suaedae]|uniref:Tetratricopeptide repeat protein n=1 Tax=Thalassobellus suaedae TaxID=3074124 RepID=A0ABY9Y1W9_9FLAO|nr:hypothetical protein RHP49_13705 [Flavobacteriaceae bacterium HL-DH10]
MKGFYIVWIGFMVCFCELYSQNNFAQDSLYLKEKGLKYRNPDSLAFHLKKDYQLKLKEKDTISAIATLIELSQLYSHNVNYGKSYDNYWEALLLADQSKDSISMFKVYHGLGWLYLFYKRDDEALKKFNVSNKIIKQLINKKNKDLMLGYVGGNYFAITNLYRDIKEYDKMGIYLDSCFQVQNELKNRPKSYYFEAESGYLASVKGNYEEALQKLNNAKNHFELNDPSYQVLLEMFFGDVYLRMGKLDETIFHYKKSLEISSKYKRHLNNDLIVNESLSNTFLKQNNFKEAYKYLKDAKTLNEQVFGRTSDNNRHLLEIKDLYRIEKKRLADNETQNRLLQLENEDKIWFLKSIILGVSIVFLIIFGFSTIRNIRNRHANEKRILKETQKLKTQKHKEIIELKNKELTESALRLVEKDEFIASIKNRLENQKDKIDVNVIKRILRSMQGNPNNNWEEFEARFTSINKSFYSNLKKGFPHLKQTDLKVCALVKLNFPSKDMSKLLGISVESVHTSRHRLRKKLNLDRNENLEEFIDNF